MALNLKLKEAIPYLIVFGVSAYLYYLASHFEYTPSPGRIGPDFWPKAILILMMAVCAYEVVKVLWFGHREVEGVLESIIEETGAEADTGEAATSDQPYPHLLAIGIVLTLAYVFLFDILGFFLDTFLYLTLFMYLGRYRRIGVILTSALTGSLVFMFVFMKIVYVSLPIGRGPFSAVSLFLMNLMGIR